MPSSRYFERYLFKYDIIQTDLEMDSDLPTEFDPRLIADLNRAAAAMRASHRV